MRLKFGSSVILFLIFCGNCLPTPAYAENWRLGVLVCLTGECAESGENSRKGIDLAVEEINQSGGVLGRNIEYVIQDTDEGKSSGLGAVNAFNKLLLDPKIKYLIGPSWTPGGLSVAPIAAKRKDIIITSPSLGVAEFDRAGENIFNLWPHDENTSRYLAKFAFEQGWKRVSVFSSQQPWELLQGNTFAAEFERLGGKILAKLEPLSTTTDLRSEILKAKSVNPDAIFFSNYTQMGNSAKQLRHAGYSGPFLAILMDESRIKLADGALDKAVYAGYADPDPGFVDRFKAKFGQAPGIGADNTYDVVKLYAWAVTEAKTFAVDQVMKTMARADLNGASGRIIFDEFGGVIKDPVLYRLEGSKSVRHLPVR